MDNSKIGHHISEQFNKELEDVRNKVLTMGGLAEEQIEQAVKAFATGNVKLAEQVIKQNDDIQDLQLAIDRECTQILALRQPTAFDLRLLITVIKIIHEIERISRKAVRIAKMGIKLKGVPRQFPHILEHMAKLVQEMLNDALDHFARMRLGNIPEIIGRDDHVDREYDNIIRQLITRMMEDPRNISKMLDVIWTVRALERIGDHACYICEHLVYMLKGENVRYLSLEELKRKVSLPR